MRLELWVYPNRDGRERENAARLLRAAADEVEREGEDAAREVTIEDAGIAHLKVEILGGASK